MKKYLTYAEMVEICERINERHMPDGERFADAVDDLLESYDGGEAKLFLLRSFQKLLALVDEEIETIEQKVQIRPTCVQGCAHCCYFPIITTKMEAKLMIDYIDHLPTKEKEAISAHLATYFQIYKEKLEQVCSIDFEENPDFKQQYIAKQLPCPFLDTGTNTCKIYEVRPIPCRTYLNYCNPNVCAASYIPEEPFSYEFLYEYYMGALNELIQEILCEEERIGIDYPDDVFLFDYLPNLLLSIKNF